MTSVISILIKGLKMRIKENEKVKMLRSENYNYNFNKENGNFERWGKTLEDDPQRSKYGPEIADIEITTICKFGCSFCSPPGTKVNIPGKGYKNIEDIEFNDIISSVHIIGDKIYPNDNTVKELYNRHYKGDLIVFELENGDILKVTDEHPIMIRDKKDILIEVLAKNVTIDMDIVHTSDFKNCNRCNNPISNKQTDQKICNNCKIKLKNKH